MAHLSMIALSTCCVFLLLVNGFGFVQGAVTHGKRNNTSGISEPLRPDYGVTVQLFTKSGHPIILSSDSGYIILTRAPLNYTSAKFYLLPCLAKHKVSSHLRPSCVSLMPVDRPGSYVRHYGWRLYAEQKTTARDRFAIDTDASFVLQRDLFHSLLYSFEGTQNAAGRFFSCVAGRSDLWCNARSNTVEFYENASFMIKRVRFAQET